MLLLRRGVTLIEMLVVFACITCLLGLSLVAIHSARSAARDTACRNNIRQIGLALQHHHDSKNQFPPGVETAAYHGSRQRGYFYIALLPYLEAQALADASDLSFSQQVNALMPSPHPQIASTLAVLACPDDDITHYVQPTYNNLQVALTDYLGCNGTNFYNRDGMLFDDSRTRFASVLDGSTSTIIVGERPPSPDNWYGWWYTGRGQLETGSLDALLGTSEVNSVDSPVVNCQENLTSIHRAVYGKYCNILRFGSYHPGGANFGFTDGSVRQLSFSVTPHVLDSLGTRAGNEIVEVP